MRFRPAPQGYPELIRHWRTWKLAARGGCLAICLLHGCGRSAVPPAPSQAASGSDEKVTESHSDNASSPTVTGPSSPDLPPNRDPSQLRQAALAAFQAGDTQTADRLVRAALLAAPDDTETIFLMALVLGQQNRFAEAIKMLDDLAELDPSIRNPAMGQTAEWMVFQGQWREAEKRYRTLLEEVDETSLIHRRLAQLFLRQGRRQDAIHHLSQLCQRGNIEEVELRALLGLDYPFSLAAGVEELEPIGPLGSARYEISQGNQDAAIAKLADSDQPGETALLGRLYAQKRDLTALSQWIDQLPNAVENKSEYGFAMGVAEAERGNHRVAVAHFCDAILGDQTDKDAYQELSESLQEIGAIDQAQEALRRAGLIEQTQILGNAMMQSDTRDLQQMTTLIDLLEQLRRPLEALAWRVVRLIYGGDSLPKSDVKRQLAEINTARLRYLQNEQPAANVSFLLCGVDPNALDEDDPASDDTTQ